MHIVKVLRKCYQFKVNCQNLSKIENFLIDYPITLYYQTRNFYNIIAKAPQKLGTLRYKFVSTGKVCKEISPFLETSLFIR